MHPLIRSKVRGTGAEKSADLVAGAVADAFNNQAIKEKLSAPTVLMLNSFGTVLDTIAANWDNSNSFLSSEELSNALSQASAAIGEMGNAIPIVGAILSFIGDVIGGAAKAEQEDAAYNQKVIQDCLQYEKIVRPLPTGANGLVPADIFHETVYIDSESGIALFGSAGQVEEHWEDGKIVGEAGITPLLGQALAAVTEFSLLPDSQRQPIEKALNQLAVLDGRAPRAFYGPPPKEAASFRKFRLAIKSTWNNEDSDDGGIVPFAVYQDLLVDAFERYELTGPVVRDMWSLWATSSGKVTSNGCIPYWVNTRGQVFALVDAWKRKIQPVYKNDKAALVKAQAQAKEILEAKLGKKFNLSGLGRNYGNFNLSGLGRNYGNSKPAPSAAPVAALGIGAVLLIALKMKGIF